MTWWTRKQLGNLYTQAQRSRLDYGLCKLQLHGDTCDTWRWPVATPLEVTEELSNLSFIVGSLESTSHDGYSVDTEAKAHQMMYVDTLLYLNADVVHAGLFE